MKHVLALSLSFFSLSFFSLSLLPVLASVPVHVTLNAGASVTANADGFFTLSQVAVFSGGTPQQQTRLASVVVGRVPLSGETRSLTGGDLLLKLRQAGLHPGTDAVVDGAAQITVTAESRATDSSAVKSSGTQSIGIRNPAGEQGTALPSAGRLAAGVASQMGNALPGSAPTSGEVVIRTGDPVAIVVQDGPIQITARGEAREAGHVGQSIRVHRTGVMTDLRATILDSQTVRLEM